MQEMQVQSLVGVLRFHMPWMMQLRPNTANKEVIISDYGSAIYKLAYNLLLEPQFHDL